MVKDQEQGLEQGQETKKKKGRNIYTGWHFLIQVLTGGAGLFVCKVVYKADSLQISDKFLIWGTIVALVIAVICSQAYNHVPGSETNPLREQAAKQRAIWLHSNFCWKVISIWMSVTSLYCTSATVYISGSAIEKNWAQERIIIYSILSLVLSMGMYMLRPTNRADGFREAYVAVNKALINDDGNGQEEIKKAIVEGEQIIARQDTMSPN